MPSSSKPRRSSKSKRIQLQKYDENAITPNIFPYNLMSCLEQESFRDSMSMSMSSSGGGGSSSSKRHHRRHHHHHHDSCQEIITPFGGSFDPCFLIGAIREQDHDEEDHDQTRRRRRRPPRTHSNSSSKSQTETTTTKKRKWIKLPCSWGSAKE